MPPDDPIVTTPTVDDPPSGAATPPDISGMVSRAINDALTPVGQAFQSLSAQVAALTSSRGNLPKDDGQGQGGGTDFLTNPDAYIAAKLQEFAKERLAPLLQPVLDDKVEANVESHRVRFDAEFGEGKFDATVGPELDTIIKNLPPNQAVSNRHVRLALDSLKGKHFDTLMEAKVASRKARADNPPPLMGGGRPAPGKPSLSSEELDFLASAERATGKRQNREEWLEERDLGNDEDSWRSHFASKRAKAEGKSGRGGIQ